LTLGVGIGDRRQAERTVLNLPRERSSSSSR
jgi:hypothetical protein